MGNGIPNRYITTWPNTDDRLNPKEFYEQRHNQEIYIHDLGGAEALNDSTGHLSQVGGLKREEGTQDAVTELKSLMRVGNIAGGDSEDNSKI